MPISLRAQREHPPRAGALPAHGDRADAPDLAPLRRARARASPRVDRLLLASRPQGAAGSDFDGDSDGMVQVCVQAEQLCWGDAALYLRMPTPALGGSAVAATGTPEQKARFLAGFRGDGPPVWGAMAITEAGAGSDAAAIQTTARLEGEQWVLNGTKIFCTSGESASQAEGGFVVVWATLDKSAGPRRDQILRRPRPDARNEAGRTGEEARDPRVGHRDAGLRGLPDSQAEPARPGGGEEAGPQAGRRQGLQGGDGDLRRQPPDRRGDGRGRRQRVARVPDRRAGAPGRRDPLRHAALRSHARSSGT